MLKWIKYVLLVVLLSGMISGCGANGDDKQKSEINLTKIGTNITDDQRTAKDAKQYVKKRKEITEVKAVNNESQLMLAFNVKAFDRFQLDKIEKNLKSDLEKRYPNYKVETSTDKKIFMELEELEKRLKDRSINKKSLESELNKLSKLMKEK
jgi:UDP-galactopyranose mutase